MVLEILLIFSGVIGTKLLYFIENGEFGGSSLFGSILFIPILILPALLMRLSYRDIVNLCAPAVGLMLAVMKCECCFKGCCFGKYLPAFKFQFPSQIVETAVTLFITIALLVLEKYKSKESLYGWLLVFYGITRLLLNGFRYGLHPFIWGLSIGHCWAMVSCIIGITWIILARIVKRKKLFGWS